MTHNSSVDAAIATIPDDQYTPVHYPGAVTDPDTGQLISGAQVSEVEYTAFANSLYCAKTRLRAVSWGFGGSVRRPGDTR